MSKRIHCMVLAGAAFASLMGSFFLSAQTEKGRTFAFLVACGDYDKTQLTPVPFIVAEMKLFREVLIDSGVSDRNIVFLHDKAEPARRFLPTRDHILDEFKLLMERLRPDDSVIVAFSGHGVQFKGDKFGYFCPLDAKLEAKDKLLPMEGDDGLLRLLDQGNAGRKFLIVNACRNNPTSNANLAKQRLELRDEYNEEAPKGTVMLLACKQNQFSWFYDDKEKREDRRNRSLFMYHLTEAWKGSYAGGKKVTIDHIIAEVGERVEADAPIDFGKNQMPLVKRKFDGHWELASPRATDPKNAKVGDVITNSMGMKLAYIPPGRFQMGSPKEEKLRKEDEFQHEVEITKPFYLGVYEVTQEEYEKLVGGDPQYLPSWFSAKGFGKAEVAGVDTRRFPREFVAWDNATEFCRKLSLKEGKPYRLPTEAEWEYACRAGTTTPFHFGKTINTNQVDYDGTTQYGIYGEKGVYRGHPGPVGRFAPNAFGLHDMHGNVKEWCQDWYGANYYESSPRQDPMNNLKDSWDRRVTRGGASGSHAHRCRAACRSHSEGRNAFLGFRVARSFVQ